MGLFDRKKTADEPKACCCGGAPAQETAAQANPEGDALVKVLGSGCPKCRALSAAAEAALAELGMEPTVGHVTDYAEMAKYGVMSTPALVVGEKVVSVGRVLSKDEALEKIRGAAGR